MVNCKLCVNRCFALTIDIRNNTETILIGTPAEVNYYINGKAKLYGTKIHVFKRSLGDFLFDFCKPAFLNKYLRTGKLFKTINNGNITNTYLKDIIDEYYLAGSSKQRKILFDAMDNALLVTQNRLINDIFLNAQAHMSLTAEKNPDVESIINYAFKSINYFEDNSNIHYWCNDDCEYIVTDFVMLPLVKYYLRILYKDKLYPRICKNCGELFIAKTHLFDVLCSDECRKVKTKEKIERYKANTNDEFEAEYKKVYQRWYTKIRRGKDEKLFTDDEIEIANNIFSQFTQKSYEMRNNARNGAISKEGYMEWISGFDIQMSMFINSLKSRNANK